MDHVAIRANHVNAILMQVVRVKTNTPHPYAFFWVEFGIDFDPVIKFASRHQNLLEGRLFNHLQFRKDVIFVRDRQMGAYLIHKGKIVGREGGKRFILHDVHYDIMGSDELLKIYPNEIDCVPNLTYIK